MNVRRTATLSRRIDASVLQVWSLLTDVATWSRWGPLTSAGSSVDRRAGNLWQPVRYGRLPLRVHVSSPDAPFWVRLHVTTPAGRFSHLADVTLAPLSDGTTQLSWRATLTGGVPDMTGRRRARLARSVSALAAQLASYAEDPPTTRLSYDAATTAAATATPEPAGQTGGTLAASATAAA